MFFISITRADVELVNELCKRIVLVLIFISCEMLPIRYRVWRKDYKHTETYLKVTLTVIRANSKTHCSSIVKLFSLKSARISVSVQYACIYLLQFTQWTTRTPSLRTWFTRLVVDGYFRARSSASVFRSLRHAYLQNTYDSSRIMLRATALPIVVVCQGLDGLCS